MKSQVLVEAAGRAIGTVLAGVGENQEKYHRIIKNRTGVPDDDAQLGLLHGVIVLAGLRKRGWVPKKGMPAAYPRIVGGYLLTAACREARKNARRKVHTVAIEFEPVAPTISWNLPIEDARQIVEKHGSKEMVDFFEHLVRLESSGLGPGSESRVEVLQEIYGLQRTAIRDRITKLRSLLAKHLLEIDEK